MQRTSQPPQQQNGSTIQTERQPKQLLKTSSPPTPPTGLDPDSSFNSPPSTLEAPRPSAAATQVATIGTGWTNNSSPRSATMTPSPPLPQSRNTLRYPPAFTPHQTSQQQPPQPIHLTISSLLQPDQNTEEFLFTLTLDQLSSIEKTVQRFNNNPSSPQTSKDRDTVQSFGVAASTSNSAIVNSNVIELAQKPPQRLHNKEFFLNKTSSQTPLSSPTTSTSHPTNLKRSEFSPSPNHALPATDPVIETHDGIPFVVFTYSVKGNNKEYRIRIDLNSANLNDITDQFKRENCLYPRAHCPEEKYQGNRWHYENECNNLGWKLAWLNQEDIAGKRGLLQRAVDSYRNRDPNMRSRRVVRNEKINNGTLRKRATRDSDSFDGNPDSKSLKRHRSAAKQLSVNTFSKGVSTKIRIRADIESVNLTDLTEDFKRKNSVFPRVLSDQANRGKNWELENWCNEIGWKLAYLNPSKLNEKKLLLQKALDLYRAKFTSEYRPRKGKYSRALSAKFFEDHPREVNSPIPMEIATNNHVVLETSAPTKSEDSVEKVNTSSSSISSITPIITINTATSSLDNVSLSSPTNNTSPMSIGDEKMEVNTETQQTAK
ncbi:12314_t:CDS:2 [Ambispora gerdemannii]|uniref:12314_t:CDS:1 n=1 Tax=Ambispora gerdemannii TaxID=144530 RepID=A0A9N8ZVL1_9GLOM|nr:12314_t:CDS:2 [Ambispora gerdemannii]